MEKDGRGRDGGGGWTTTKNFSRILELKNKLSWERHQKLKINSYFWESIAVIPLHKRMDPNNRKHWRILFLAILIILSSIAFCKKFLGLKN